MVRVRVGVRVGVRVRASRHTPWKPTRTSTISQEGNASAAGAPCHF